ncbi:MAG: hypothetical protein K2X27_25775 [Candidatus Obscuribacterales bacterium]|nr:hypothetical protein [Candidatus Obscuribacterales bacterium]
MTLQLNRRSAPRKNSGNGRAKMRTLKFFKSPKSTPVTNFSSKPRTFTIETYLGDPALDNYEVLETLSAHSQRGSVRAKLLVRSKTGGSPVAHDCEPNENDVLELLPRREPMRRLHNYNERSSIVARGPLVRFLTQSLGKPITEIKAELDRRLPTRYSLRSQMLDTFERMIVESAYFDEAGAVRDSSRIPDFNQLSSGVFYVHPEHGTLEQVQPQPKAEPKPSFEQLAIGDLQKLVKVDGLWYVVDFAPVTLPEPSDYLGYDKLPVDILTGDRAYIRKPLPWDRGGKNIFEQNWGAKIYAVSKRSAGKTLLRRHGLRG